MRCLCLADALRRRGATVRVVSRQLPPALGEMLAARGHEVAAIGGPADPPAADDLAHAGWLGTTQAADAAATAAALAPLTWDWLVVDHYALDARWEASLRPHARHIMVIDDLADRTPRLRRAARSEPARRPGRPLCRLRSRDVPAAARSALCAGARGVCPRTCPCPATSGGSRARPRLVRRRRRRQPHRRCTDRADAGRRQDGGRRRSALAIRTARQSRKVPPRRDSSATSKAAAWRS